jgi:hypothetical protein
MTETKLEAALEMAASKFGKSVGTCKAAYLGATR